MTNNFEQLKIGDLGVACKINCDNTLISPSKSVVNQVALDESMKVGTPFYLAPEIWSEHTYSMKSDMWALGVTLYEMCTKQKPFIAENVDALKLLVTEGNIDVVYPPNIKVSSDAKEIIS